MEIHAESVSSSLVSKILNPNWTMKSTSWYVMQWRSVVVLSNEQRPTEKESLPLGDTASAEQAKKMFCPAGDNLEVTKD